MNKIAIMSFVNDMYSGYYHIQMPDQKENFMTSDSHNAFDWLKAQGFRVVWSGDFKPKLIIFDDPLLG